MKPGILLRISSILMLLHTLGHSIGASTWNKAPNAVIGKLIDGMVNDHFDFMGKSVTLASFYAGYGYILIAVLLFLTLILWLLSIEPHARIILALGLLLLAFGILEFIFFFAMAAVFSTVAGLLTLWAYPQTRKS